MIAENGGIEIQPLAHYNRESPKMVQEYVDDSKSQMTTFVTGVNVKTKVGLSTEVVTSSIMGQKSDEAQKTEAEEQK